MNHRALILLGLFGLGATVGLLVGASPAPSEIATWEYAAYRSLGNRHQWQTPETEIFARGLPDFCRQLGLKTKMTEAAAETELINHFGRQGWELVEMSPPGGTRGTWIFWFKRPAH